MTPSAGPGPRSRAWLPLPSFVALVGAVVAVLAIAWLSYRALDARTAAATAVNRTNQVQDHLHRFLSHVKDAESAQRGYLLTGVERYLEPYHLARGAIASELAQLRRMAADDPDHQQQLAALEALVAGTLDELARTIAIQRGGDPTGALAIVNTDSGRLMMDQLRHSVDGMLLAEQNRLDHRAGAWEAAVVSSSYIMLGGVAVVLVMLGLVGVLASRDFRAVAAEGWARRVHLALSSQLQGDVKLGQIGDKVLRTLADNFGARVATLYAVEPGALRRIAGHARAGAGEPPAVIALGEGLIGQAAREARTVHVRDLPVGYLEVSSSIGRSPPRELVILPAIAEGTVEAVVELGFTHRLEAVELAALERLSESIAQAIRTARDRSRLEELLEEVQRQSEELHSQQDELRASNQELEQQTRALQLSQARLETQQSELEEINAQLADQARSLARQRDELTHATSELARSNQVKSQFLANVSHELRTPLNSALILARLLADNRDHNLSAEQVRFAETIYVAGNDLLTLINDILDLSKIEAGMLEVRTETVVVARLVDELVVTFQPLVAARGIALAVATAGAPARIDSDPTRLSQILKNLVANAIKFTERGSVTIAVSERAGAIEFAVTDTGIGIAADQHELIFEAFRQADGEINRRFGGTGLGLSISRDLARLLGGELTVASQPGQGSTFTLRLPVRSAVATAPPAATAHIPVVAAAARPASAPAGILPIQDGQPGEPPFADDRGRMHGAARSLLVIEDDPVFARVLYDLAHELEFLAAVATTAADGLALVRRSPPSAIVLDLGLPDRSGLAVLDALKRDPAARHIPVHVVSASDHARSALEMGAVGYAVKPVERRQLIDAIQQLEARFTQKLRRVLIAEDDPVLRASTARLLAGDDVEIVTAATAAAALSELASSAFDCVVLDLGLPGDGDRQAEAQAGIDLLEGIARGEHPGCPPVIVYTGRSLSPGEIHGLERLSRSIIIKGARSPERLLDEVTLFLHQVESRLPPERQRMLRDVRDREAVFEGRRILVVEDDVRNVFALASVLERRGASVEIARNGRAAIELLHDRPSIDLVLMDVMMPELDGLEATRQLRRDPRFARLPIIALTAKAMIDDRDKCLAAGASDYIAKPLDIDKLLSLARVWIRT